MSLQIKQTYIVWIVWKLSIHKTDTNLHFSREIMFQLVYFFS